MLLGARFSTPLGELLAIAHASTSPRPSAPASMHPPASLVLLEFADRPTLSRQLRRLSTWLRIDAHPWAMTADPWSPLDPSRAATPAHAVLATTGAWLDTYFADPSAPSPPPALHMPGTPLQCRVWQALLAISPGTTRSYAQLARQIGAAHAVRAVAGAVGANRIALIVPCHRVVGSDATLTGYAGGVHRKRALLELEQASNMLLSPRTG